MQTTFALAALAAVAAALPQATDGSGAVTAAVSPTGSAPATAQTSYPGPFQLTVVNITSTAAKAKRQSCGTSGTLTTTLNNGVLTDSEGRTGYIASNRQFQYDSPPQAGAIYTAGFSILSNSSLALGSSAVFYSCYTGGFSNLYDENFEPQCVPVLLNIIPCSGSSSASAGVSQISDGQPQATTAVSAVSQISDGQVQATTVAPMPISQISDGQLQMPTGAPISQISDGQIQVTSAGAPISQISDGQIQATATGAPISQISDGQIQATAAATTSKPAVVSQIGDGQVQVPTAAPAPVVSQISDGQIQATSAVTAPVVSQISDGQIQATAAASTTSKPAVVSQISDGQIQATAAANATVTPIAFTGAANGLTIASAMSAVVAGVAMLLL